MRLLQKSTWPRVLGGQKLQPVPYPIYRSRIAICIARSPSLGFLAFSVGDRARFIGTGSGSGEFLSPEKSPCPSLFWQKSLAPSFF